MNKTSNDHMTKKRLLIFLGVAFLFSWTFGFLNLLFVDEVENPSLSSLLSYLGMFGPALGTLTARLVTKEGFRTAYLQVNLKGNGLYYCTAFLLAPVISLISILIISLAYTDGFHLVYPAKSSLMLFLSNLSLAVMGVTIIFGEEFGWRAYLYPKLRELMHPLPALLLCNCIWGVWHFPALLSGLNFGKDTPFFPVSNVLLMCLYCIFIGTIETYLTEKTGSVYPATLFHSVNNNANVIFFFFTAEEYSSIPVLQVFAANFIAVLPFFLLCLILLLKMEKKKIVKV